MIRNSKIILIFLVTSILLSCSIFKKEIDLEGKDIECKIFSIDSVSLQFYYYIEMLYKKDTIHLLSFKDNQCIQNSNELKIGNSYILNLKQIYSFPLTVLNNGDTVMRRLVGSDYRVNHNLPAFQQYPYISKDLCGLKYIREKKSGSLNVNDK